MQKTMDELNTTNEVKDETKEDEMMNDKSPRVVQIVFGRTFAVGKFESERITLHIEFSERPVVFADEVRNAYMELRKQVLDLYIEGLKHRQNELEGRLQAEKELEIPFAQEIKPSETTPTPKTKPKTETPAWITQELKNHRWNAKKIEGQDGMYTEGSLSWGWDWPNKFSNELVEWLKKSSIILETEDHIYEIVYDQNMVKTKSFAQ